MFNRTFILPPLFLISTVFLWNISFYHIDLQNNGCVNMISKRSHSGEATSRMETIPMPNTVPELQKEVNTMPPTVEIVYPVLSRGGYVIGEQANTKSLVGRINMLKSAQKVREYVSKHSVDKENRLESKMPLYGRGTGAFAVASAKISLIAENGSYSEILRKDDVKLGLDNNSIPTAIEHDTKVNDVAMEYVFQIFTKIQEEGRDSVKLSERTSSCEEKAIYVYNLPPKFNVDLVRQCDSLNPWLNMCNSFANFGLGKPVTSHAESVLLPKGQWYDTNQYALELVFHSRVLQHPCLTSDPEKAMVFYIPYYGGLDVMRWHFAENVTNERKDKLGSELAIWLEEQSWWRRHRGRDHVMALGKISYDFRRAEHDPKAWGSNFLLHPQMQNMLKLLIERHAWHENDIGVPHPTFFHPKSDNDIRSWQEHIHTAQRGNLVSFAGQPRPNQLDNVRNRLIQQCQQYPAICHLLDCTGGVCFRPESTMSLFLQSHFCLQPPGDSPTRRSVFDSLIAGCIPVLFDPFTAYLQYPWHLPINTTSYSIFIPSKALRDGRINVIEVLQKIPVRVIEEMRKKIIYDIVPGLVYAEPGSKLLEYEDAFDISIRNIFTCIELKKLKR
ncbi:hypothetical protein O6H91_Y095000 [Diphasiastrum complanatum]|nr:hypothetical protein O6H91_Y095000 [Diphasiastrum complanatum]